MTAYTTISDSRVAPEAPLDTSLVTELRDNPIAITEGASGAPKIKTAALDDLAVTTSKIALAAIGQSRLKTSTGEVSHSGTVGANLTLPGGEFGFYPRIRTSNVASNAIWGGAYDGSEGYAAYTSSTSDITRIFLRTSSAYYTAYARQRYVQSSPPYDLGDGEIPLFIFVELDSNGEIISGYSAQEAPWHNNGPTNLTAHIYDESGRGYRKRKDMSNIQFTLDDARADQVKMAEYLDAFSKAEEILEPITQEEKQKDMPLIPRPMNPSDGNTVILLDPVCDMTHRLFELTSHDQFSVLELLRSGYIDIDNTPINRAAPPGVGVHSFRWGR